MANAKRLLIIQVAGLGYDFFLHHNDANTWRNLTFSASQSVFPAVTCTVQASMRTAQAPAQHGMIANGIFDRTHRRAQFWEQSSALVEGPRVWERFRAAGKRVGMLFWQQSLGEAADLVVSPWPVHTHGGGMVDALYAQPSGLAEEITRAIGRKFRLNSYWGPLARAAATRWITDATTYVMRSFDHAPECLFTYLPHLDYVLQRKNDRTPQAAKAFHVLMDCLEQLHVAAQESGYEIVLYGDYALGVATEAIFPNRLLRAAGLLATRRVHGRLYPDLHASRAFAMVDHEIAHIYVRDPADIAPTREALLPLHDKADLLEGNALDAAGVQHPRSGELLLCGRNGAWCAYPWWTHPREAPDYATHIDIHNKPGYDPCELFWGWPPFSISQNTARVAGTHGRIGSDRQVAWTSTLDTQQMDTLLDLAQWIQTTLDEMASA